MDQTITIIVSILIPMIGGFGWIVTHLMKIENRLTALETIVSFTPRRRQIRRTKVANKRGPGRPRKKTEEEVGV